MIESSRGELGAHRSSAPADRAARLLLAERTLERAGDAAIRWRVEALDPSAGDAQRSLDGFLQAALVAVRDQLEADTASFLVADDDGTELVARASVGLPEEISLTLHIHAGEGVAGRVFATREPLIIDELSADQLASPLLSEGGVRSLVAVPVRVEDRGIGVLHAGSFKPAAFGPDDIFDLTLLSERLAAAMERVRLFESERSAKETAENMAVLIGHLQRITAALTLEVSEEDAARTVCREVTASAGGDIAGCTLWMRRAEVLELIHPDDVASPALEFAEMSLDEPYPGCEVIRTGEALWLESHQQMVDRFPILAGSDTLGARFAVMPLKASEVPFGVLAFSFETPGSFARHERDFLLAVAEQASQAFERARLRSFQQRVARHDAVLSRLSGTLALSLDYDETIAQVVGMLVPAIADIASIHLFDEAGRLVRAAFRHRDRSIEASIESQGDEGNPESVLAALRYVADHQEFVAIDMRLASTMTPRLISGQAAEALRPLEISTVLVTRLSDRERVLGVLSVSQAGSGRSFPEEDHSLIMEIGRRAGVAIANAQLHAKLREAQRVERFLLEVTKALASAGGYLETLERLGTAAVPTLGDLCLIDLLDADGELNRVVAHHHDPTARPLVQQLRTRYSPKADSDYPSAQAVREKQSVFSPDMPEAFLQRISLDENHLSLMKQLRWESYLAVPLVASDTLLGAVTLISSGSGRRYGPADVAIAEQLADQVSAVVDQARRYDREHRISHLLQSSLLPADLPSVPGLEIAVRYVPGTRDAEVGGDFYDAVILPSGLVALTIGDVAGHDHQAAAVMGRLRSAVRTLNAQLEGPAEVLESLQRNWRILGLDRMATAVFCLLDPATGELQLVSAGHPPPLVVADSRAEYLPLRIGVPLGAPPQPAEAWTGRIELGETLVFFTDGAIEDRTRDVNESMEALAVCAARGPTEVEALCDELIASIGPDRSDDVALLAVMWTGTP